MLRRLTNQETIEVGLAHRKHYRVLINDLAERLKASDDRATLIIALAHVQPDGSAKVELTAKGWQDFMAWYHEAYPDQVVTLKP